MSEPILIALVQLFAIVAASVAKRDTTNSRTILESYLKQHLNNQELDEYLKLYDELSFFHQDEEINSDEISEKIRTICEKIQKQLPAKDRLIIFVKFSEFVAELTQDELDTKSEYLLIFKEVFNFPDTEFNAIRSFIFQSDDNQPVQNLLVIDSEGEKPEIKHRHLFRDKLSGRILVLFVPSVRTLICRYTGQDELFLNGHSIPAKRSFVLNNGSILKNPKISPIYFADVIAHFHQTAEKLNIEFTAKEVEYRFKNSTNGIHPFSFTAHSGELIGVMGGSGVGKSTLLNVLNGNLSLYNGNILINGYDLEKDEKQLEGIIGFVPQDDLLIEELSVFQNLYYNAKLCFDGFGHKQLIRSVMRVLMDIDLIGIRNLTVGDSLNKFISGGQRKRLNIALELIREPAVLFADEPTSGLSSMDSEMVMLLLKEQTLKGRLVIVNIHQPSSDIFKLFDKLLIMDKGGYPIYYGNPIDAVTWFKTASSHANPDESECQNCGYVNPEQILQITEAKIVNEYGRQTNTRKTAPKEWYELFTKHIQPGLKAEPQKSEIPKSHFKVPGRTRQFRIFGIRNLLTKITNRQYMLINLIEGPLLAALLAYLTRFSFGDHYVFGNNRNLVPYLFMSVVVSLFLGMMVSAEEIIKDRRILKREAFLNLSWFSYLNSKIALLFVLSGIQSILYVLTGNLILGIQDMTLSYWLILFSTACFANMVGLNISAGLNSVVAIYILIPFILVPQLLLSGTIVPFDHLNPAIASRERVPLVGNLMTSRWTFEALAVEQFKNNRYEKIFYPYEKEISHYSYITAYVVPTLKSKLDECQLFTQKGIEPEKVKNSVSIFMHELTALQKEAGFSEQLFPEIESAQFSHESVSNAKNYLDSVSRYFSSRMNSVTQKKDKRYQQLVGELGRDAVNRLKEAHYNENIADLVLNNGGENKVIDGEGILIRKKDPVFMDPVQRDGQAHFYAPVKILGNWRIDTLWFNVAVIWLMSLVLYFALVYDLLRKAIELFGRLKF